jgi:hypothetical protein
MNKYWDFKPITPMPKKGDFIYQCQKMYEMDSDPSKLGKCRAFNYTGNDTSKFREPRLVLGPQWYYPVAEIIIVNTISILVMIFGNHARFKVTIAIGIFLLIVQNLLFLYFTF